MYVHTYLLTYKVSCLLLLFLDYIIELFIMLLYDNITIYIITAYLILLRVVHCRTVILTLKIYYVFT